jgi:BioD-like phosphotransacetylase family protein
MKKLIIASTSPSAGKTSMIVGLAAALGKRCGYMKPFGDRLIYHKKRLWDYDAALAAAVLKLEEQPEDMSIGLEHIKLGYMSADDVGDKLKVSVEKMSRNKEVLFIEGGKTLAYGASVHLDVMSLARHLGAPVVLVMAAGHDAVDEAAFVLENLKGADVEIRGAIINKTHDPEDFRNTHGQALEKLGLPLLGIIPFHEDLNCTSVAFLADRLFAKVIAGESGLKKVVRNIFVGAMSANAALRSPKFNKGDKLIITAGDRVDMILAALESDTSGIILTNNILPPSNIISKATDRQTPVLLVPTDTYQIAQQIDNMEPLLTPQDENKIALLESFLREHVDLDRLGG